MENRLKVIAVVHIAVGFVVGLISLITLGNVAMTLVKSGSQVGGSTGSGPVFPDAFVEILESIILILGITGLVFGLLMIVSGKYMLQRRRRAFSMVIGALGCVLLGLPGIILGVPTLIILSKGECQGLYSD